MHHQIEPTIEMIEKSVNGYCSMWMDRMAYLIVEALKLLCPVLRSIGMREIRPNGGDRVPDLADKNGCSWFG